MEFAAWFRICCFDKLVVSAAKSASITRPIACSVMTEALLWLAIEKFKRLINEPIVACSLAMVCNAVSMVPITVVALAWVAIDAPLIDKPVCPTSEKLIDIVSAVVVPAWIDTAEKVPSSKAILLNFVLSAMRSTWPRRAATSSWGVRPVWCVFVYTVCHLNG